MIDYEFEEVRHPRRSASENFRNHLLQLAPYRYNQLSSTYASSLVDAEVKIGNFNKLV